MQMRHNQYSGILIITFILTGVKLLAIVSGSIEHGIGYKNFPTAFKDYLHI
jgi:hypothetical protein